MHAMSQTAAKPAFDIKSLVLTEIRGGPIRPTELLTRLQENSGVSEDRAKSALAALIDSYTVELTPDRYLRIAGKKSS